MLLIGWKSVESVPKLVEEYLGKKLKVDEFVTHTFKLDGINEAFHLMHEGKRSEDLLKLLFRLMNDFFFISFSIRSIVEM